jgi:hypothetical protein
MMVIFAGLIGVNGGEDEGMEWLEMGYEGTVMVDLAAMVEDLKWWWIGL